MNKKEVLVDYIKFRSLKNKTCAINDIENHVKWFLFSSKKSLDEFDEKILIDYVSIINLKYSVEMLNKIKSACLKNFIKWYFVDWSSRFRNIDAILKTEKAPSRFTSDDMLSENDFKKLIFAEESRFWRAYFMTLFYGSCRPVEVCLLSWKDVEFEKEDDGAFITIYSKKNRRSFIKYLPSDVAFYLKELKNNNSEWVFYNSKTHLPITKKGAYARIRSLSDRVLGRKIDLYTLRHSIGTINYSKDGPNAPHDDDVAEQMGHEKSMKGVYVHRNRELLKARVKKIYVPVDNLPLEKKHILEKRLEVLESVVSNQQKIIDYLRLNKS